MWIKTSETVHETPVDGFGINHRIELIDGKYKATRIVRCIYYGQRPYILNVEIGYFATLNDAMKFENKLDQTEK